MSFGEAISSCFSKYASFEGRARRREYWYFALLVFAVYAVLVGIAVGADSSALMVLAALWILAVLLPSISVTVRRLHDIGKSGWWYWINLVPLIGGIWLLVLTLTDSQHGPNQYGPSPKYPV